MAGDWTKMRTDLYRDPKVCLMADLLLDGEGDLGRFVNQNCQRNMTVTRNVMRNAVVGALVSVWGVSRLRGKRTGNDLTIAGATVSIIDDIADVPGFGAAMRRVGWVVDTENGILFPRFYEEYNVEPTAEHKLSNAERQRRFRERRNAESNATRYAESNAEVTKSNAREEKSREEKKEEEDPPTPHGGAAEPVPKVSPQPKPNPKPNPKPRSRRESLSEKIERLAAEQAARDAERKARQP